MKLVTAKPKGLLLFLALILTLLAISGCTRIISPYVLTQTSVAGQNGPTQTELAKTGLVLSTLTPTPPSRDPAVLIQYFVSQTAIAAHATPTVTPAPSGTPLGSTAAQTTPPAPSPTLTAPNPGVAWRNLPVLGPIIYSLENLGDNPIVVAIVSALLTLFAVFFRSIFAWLGRTLSWFWSLIRMRGRDYEFEKEYLDWMISQHRHLGILPAQVVARRWGDRQQFVDLEDVFVRLSISGHAGDESQAQSVTGNGYSWTLPPWWLSLTRIILKEFFGNFPLINIFGAKFDLAGSWYVTAPKVEPGSFGTVIDRNRRLVLRGDPGSGKTTLLRYLAVTCARDLRQNLRDGDQPHLAGERLGWGKRPFPILVKLSRHSNVLKWDQDHSLADAIRDELPADLRRKCPLDFFEIRLKERPCLILLDAFDELGSPAARAEMAQRINGFLEVYEKPMHRVLVTTRIVGYEGQLNRLGFHVRSVQPLQDGDIRALVKLRYRSIGISETVGRNEIDARAIQRKLADRAQSLIARIENTQQLRLLATNPLLLSLIVLVHFLKVELPDERILLYRDCVEILTERWQQYRREEAGAQQLEAETLTLTQKLLLLREIAYAMQLRRDQNNSQALIRKASVVSIIAQKLPEILGASLPEEKTARQVECTRYAEGWVKSIEASSGILVEQGLDQDGEPLIGFSHLTFQEYLTAVALYEVPEYQAELWRNLHNPSWREVILLFVVLANDAMPIINELLASEVQPSASLLAGSCLTEKVRKVDPEVQARVLEKVKEIFAAGEREAVEMAGAVLGAMLNGNIVDFLLQQVSGQKETNVLAAIRALGNLKPQDASLVKVRDRLVALLEVDSSVDVKIAARETLSRIGDPRFINDDPLLVYVPLVTLDQAKPHKPVAFKFPLMLNLAWLKDRTKIEWLFSDLGINLDWFLKNLIRNGDLAVGRAVKRLFKNSTYTGAFAVSKFPVTNFEYGRFVDETNHRPPLSWKEGTYSQERGSYPVTGITVNDAVRYCRWLREKTGKGYRLPTEWEWEIAAGGPQVQSYPWGEKFRKDSANTAESELGDLTPVGTFYNVASPYGAQDTCGNAQQYTYMSSPVSELLRSVSMYVFAGLMMWFPSVLGQIPSTANSIFATSLSFADFVNVIRLFQVFDPRQIGAILVTKIDTFFLLFYAVLFYFFAAIMLFYALRATFAWARLLYKIGTGTDSAARTGFCLRGGSWREERITALSFFRISLDTSAYTGSGYIRGAFHLNDKGFRVLRSLAPDEVEAFSRKDQP